MGYAVGREAVMLSCGLSSASESLGLIVDGSGEVVGSCTDIKPVVERRSRCKQCLSLLVEYPNCKPGNESKTALCTQLEGRSTRRRRSSIRERPN